MGFYIVCGLHHLKTGMAFMQTLKPSVCQLQGFVNCTLVVECALVKLTGLLTRDNCWPCIVCDLHHPKTGMAFQQALKPGVSVAN